MGLYARLVEGFGPCTDRLVGVLAVHQIHLLEGTAVGLYAVEATHAHDDRRYAHQLVHSRLVFAAALPHIAVYQTKFYLFCHSVNPF